MTWATTVSGMTRGQLAPIERWHDAVNTGDAAGAGALCTADVEVGGPRGSGYGRELVVEWVGHAGIRIRPVRWFCGTAPDGSSAAVVEQDAQWPDGSGGLTDAVRVATAFRLHDGVITSVVRHGDVGAALAGTGLTAGDEVLTRA